MAGPERIELPPPGSKPGMISISPKADVKNPAVILSRAQGRAVLLAEAVRFELTDLLQPTVFKTVAIDHSATLPRLLERVPRIELGTKPWQGFEIPLHHTRKKLGGECGSRTHSTAHHHRRISNPMPYHPAHSPCCYCYYIAKFKTSQSKSGTASEFKGSQVSQEPTSHM